MRNSRVAGTLGAGLITLCWAACPTHAQSTGNSTGGGNSSAGSGSSTGAGSSQNSGANNPSNANNANRGNRDNDNANPRSSAAQNNPGQSGAQGNTTRDRVNQGGTIQGRSVRNETADEQNDRSRQSDLQNPAGTTNTGRQTQAGTRTQQGEVRDTQRQRGQGRGLATGWNDDWYDVPGSRSRYDFYDYYDYNGDGGWGARNTYYDNDPYQVGNRSRNSRDYSGTTYGPGSNNSRYGSNYNNDRYGSGYGNRYGSQYGNDYYNRYGDSYGNRSRYDYGDPYGTGYSDRYGSSDDYGYGDDGGMRGGSRDSYRNRAMSGDNDSNRYGDSTRYGDSNRYGSSYGYGNYNNNRMRTYGDSRYGNAADDGYGYNPYYSGSNDDFDYSDYDYNRGDYGNDRSGQMTDTGDRTGTNQYEDLAQNNYGARRNSGLQGEIVSTQSADYFGNRHTIAKIRGENGREYVVDLGPEDRLSDLDLTEGQSISVNGRRGMMTAGQITANDRTVTIDDRWEQGAASQRPGRMRGTVETLQTRSIGGDDHLIAYVESDNRRGLERIDLGPKDKVGERGLKVGDQIEVEGTQGRGDRSNYFVAQRLRTRDLASIQQESRSNALSGNRDRNSLTNQQSNASQPAGMSVYSGQIVKQDVGTVDGQPHVLATVKLYDGRQYQVDLGPRSRLSGTNIGNGDEVQFQGLRSDIGGEQGLRASRVKIGDGDWTEVAQAGTGE